MNKLIAAENAKKIKKELLLNLELYWIIEPQNVDSFCIWAGIQRLDYKTDLAAEVKDFHEGELGPRKRMYHTNSKEWKRISLDVFKRDDYTCLYCKKRGGILECDHKIPFSKGGSNDKENLATSCRRCNRQKKDRTHLDFMKYIQDHTQ